MSGFGRNVIPRRAHKERAQPSGRIAKHGLLEKKKDYKKRAKNANRKAARLKLLREKAAFRNPDEFYYGMIKSAGTSDGRMRKTRDVAEAMGARDGETRLLASSRDAGYVGLKHSMESGKLRTLEKRLHFLDAAAATPRNHTVFVVDDDALQTFKPVSTEPASGAVARRPSSARAAKDEASRMRAYSQYEQRRSRKEKLTAAMQDIDLEKKLMGKGARYKVKDASSSAGTPVVFKWRQQRKR